MRNYTSLKMSFKYILSVKVMTFKNDYINKIKFKSMFVK